MYDNLYRLVRKVRPDEMCNDLMTGRPAFDDRFALVDLQGSGLSAEVLGDVIDQLSAGPLTATSRDFRWRDQTREVWFLAPAGGFSWDPGAFYDGLYWTGDIDRIYVPDSTPRDVSAFQINTAWLSAGAGGPVAWTFNTVMLLWLCEALGQEAAA